ncbi:Uncharacterised protein [Legionella pneumophila]|nr:Uncharacterised protein [Legionella pneumophila]
MFELILLSSSSFNEIDFGLKQIYKINDTVHVENMRNPSRQHLRLLLPQPYAF